MNTEKLFESLQKHEGCELKAYQDTEGVWTIGYGRNLQEMKITQNEADVWLVEDMTSAINEAQRLPEYQFCDTPARRNVFAEMVFNLGVPRLRRFRKMLAALRGRDFGKAAVEMLDSKWATQVGRRAEVLATMMRTGEFPG